MGFPIGGWQAALLDEVVERQVGAAYTQAFADPESSRKATDSDRLDRARPDDAAVAVTQGM